MSLFDQFIGKDIVIFTAGKVAYQGTLIDKGDDVVVLYDGNDFFYIPAHHIKNVHLSLIKQEGVSGDQVANPLDGLTDGLTLRKILKQAKGIFIELHVVKGHPIHGYVTSVMNDYIVFYSPVYKNILIPFTHIKALIPYKQNETPYLLDERDLPIKPTTLILTRTFEEHLKKCLGKVVIFDLGGVPEKIGKLENIENQLIELITAREKKEILHIRHIQTVHFIS